ncbi:228653fb-a531-47f2-9fd6-a60750073651 [Sclerotinia trifoliorum]|uniref:228653fb-a531-47f2-9fd6-a60750073651 n=1 Tax=Sclerotinia trifoliorum TaxID=28548 RepID=A0A8H2VPC1_9HELO|nr:228653fb-a531-47f2-9fd6-a60750073651 [Sclerotinia trifoliorum]
MPPNTDTNGLPNQDNRNDAHEEHSSSLIAIIGIGCRLPGGAQSPSQLWDLLIEQRSGWSQIPASRFNSQGFYNPNKEHSGTITTTGGFFLDNDIRLFDNSFFGINNLEAKYMDPQQKQVLEVVYECLESAGLPIEKVSGADIGCYIANFTTDYTTIQSKDPDSYHRYGATGMEPSILANRVSHVFNLKGPSCTINTACSSSLYSLHQACTALEAGECEAAIVAGANLIQTPEMQIGVVKLGVVSPTSTSHTFDTAADGYGRGEAVGALLVKRLSDAVRDGDAIRAVIRGTAVNSNGKTPGITLPSADGQEAVIRKAYLKAGLPLDATDYIEAHGTGTPVGDPIEIEAISRALQHRSGRPILVGSVKTNLGHSEAVSGISSVIKVILSLEKGLIPPTIGIKNINPALRLEERNVSVVTGPIILPLRVPIRASINSFGYGGANSHAILESAQEYYPNTSTHNNSDDNKSRKTYLLPFSAHSEISMKGWLQLLASQRSTVRIEDLAYTLGCRRSKLSSRGFILAQKDNLDYALDVANLETLAGPPKTSIFQFAFIFTGQGAQWPQMGKELIEEIPGFRQTIRDLDGFLAKLGNAPPWKIYKEIMETDQTSRISHSYISQTVCTAIQIATVLLMKEWGIEPSATVGHSSGEIAAAFASGNLTAEEAIIIAYCRGIAVSQNCKRGAMIAVGLGQDTTNAEISRLELCGQIRVACINSPNSVTVSGDLEAINQIMDTLQATGTFVRRLKTDGNAYHSHHMASLTQNYEDLLLEAGLFLQPGKATSLSAPIKMISSVTGQPVDAERLRSRTYWCDNLESPVLFQGAIQVLMKGNEYHLIEIGPHPALELPIKDIRDKLRLQQNQMLYSSTLTRHKNSIECILRLMGYLYIGGREIPFEKINDTCGTARSTTGRGCKFIHDLPTYRWNHESLNWVEPRISIEYRNRKHPRHDLLGSRIPGGSGETASWRNLLRVDIVPWLKDHKLGKSAVFPAAGYIAMAAEAIQQLQALPPKDDSVMSFRDLKFIKMLELLDEHEIFTEMRKASISEITESGTWWHLNISSFNAGTSIVHMKGLVAIRSTAYPFNSKVTALDEHLEKQSPRSWYNTLAKAGLNFGPKFQSMLEVYHNPAKDCYQTVSKTRLLHTAGTDYESTYTIHPITIDTLLQTAITSSSAGLYANLRGKIPVSISHMEIRQDAAKHDTSDICTINADSEVVGFGPIKYNVELHDHFGKVLIYISNGRAISYEEGSDASNDKDSQPITQTIWKPDISLLSHHDKAAFARYIKQFPLNSEVTNPSARELAAVLNLIAHQNPNLRVLDLHGTWDYDNNRQQSLLQLYSEPNQLKGFREYFEGIIDSCGKFVAREVNVSQVGSLKFGELHKIDDEKSFNVMILPKCTRETISDTRKNLQQCLKHLSSTSTVIFASNQAIDTRNLELPEFSFITSIPTGPLDSVIVARRRDAVASGNEKGREIIYVTRSCTVQRSFDSALRDRLSTIHGYNISLISFEDVSADNILPNAVIISTIELQQPILRELSEDELSRLKILTDNASEILWVTCGGLSNSKSPDFALSQGFFRSLGVEQPSLKLFLLDLEDIENDIDTALRHTVTVFVQAMENSKPDFEYIQHEGALYCGRFFLNTELTERFQQAQTGHLTSTALKDAGAVQISIDSTGQLDSLHFIQHMKRDATLRPDYVEVEVRVVGMNAKDPYALKGRVDTKNSTCSCEFTGVVVRAGSLVDDLVPGDSVVVMAPGHLSNYERVPYWACCKLRPNEPFEFMSTIPLAFSTAIYALRHRANLQKDESVLIHSAAGGVGIAAIQIAQQIGSEIFATVGSERKRKFLIDSFGLKDDHIFNSRDSSFVAGILKSTAGKGVDVILNSLVGELLQEGWRACANFGRFIELGKRDIVDGGKLDMAQFERNVTFSAFDLGNLFYSDNKRHNNTWRSLLQESVQLYRDGKIWQDAPLKTFDASQVVQAFNYFSLGTRIGKIAISFQNPNSMIKLAPLKFKAKIDPTKSYLLVGCLGGLGQSLARWMFQRGARKFVFLGRSGLAKKEAKLLVANIEQAGGQVSVVRGDVAVLADVESAIAHIEGPIGGVVQSAMALDEALFTQMTWKRWHTSINPKVNGTWNLHKSLAGKEIDLDFFLMMSSIAGTIGTATETSYCASNSFLDSFAGYRRGQGLKATSIALGMISEIGYMHEHPEIEAGLLRQGLHPITEDEFLQIVDLALTTPEAEDTKPFNSDQILTGLAVTGIKKIRNMGFESSSPSRIFDDPRALFLANDIIGQGTTSVEETSNSLLPPSVAAALAAHKNDPSHEALLKAITTVLVNNLSNAILMETDKLDINMHFGVFGLDSMLAAELRQFIFRSLEVDIKFTVLLATNTTVASLAGLIVQKLVEKNKL